jgi:hypothetical protein
MEEGASPDAAIVPAAFGGAVGAEGGVGGQGRIVGGEASGQHQGVVEMEQDGVAGSMPPRAAAAARGECALGQDSAQGGDEESRRRSGRVAKRPAAGGKPPAAPPRQRARKARPPESPAAAFFQQNHYFCGFLADGFYKIGRGKDEDTPLAPLNTLREGHARVILLDSREGRDPELLTILRQAEGEMSRMSGRGDSQHTLTRRLSVLVAERLGGNERDDLEAASEMELERVMRGGGVVVRIGELKVGWCDTRALLFKYLVDRVLPQQSCVLLRGEYLDPDDGVTYGHAWNVVDIHRQSLLVDVCIEPGKLLERGKCTKKHYRRLLRRGKDATVDDPYVSGAGLESILRPEDGTKQLSQYFAGHDALSYCLDTDGGQVMLGKPGTSGYVTKAELTSDRLSALAGVSFTGEDLQYHARLVSPFDHGKVPTVNPRRDPNGPKMDPNFAPTRVLLILFIFVVVWALLRGGRLGAPLVVAVKRLNQRLNQPKPSTVAVADFRNEITLHFGLGHHENIVRPVACFTARPDDMFLALEFMSGGSLEDALHDREAGEPRPDWLRWKHVMADVASAIHYLQSLDPIVIHRDIKSANVVLNIIDTINTSSVAGRAAALHAYVEPASPPSFLSRSGISGILWL